MVRNLPCPCQPQKKTRHRQSPLYVSTFPFTSFRPLPFGLKFCPCQHNTLTSGSQNIPRPGSMAGPIGHRHCKTAPKVEASHCPAQTASGPQGRGARTYVGKTGFSSDFLDVLWISIMQKIWIKLQASWARIWPPMPRYFLRAQGRKLVREGDLQAADAEQNRLNVWIPASCGSSHSTHGKIVVALKPVNDRCTRRWSRNTQIFSGKLEVGQFF